MIHNKKISFSIQITNQKIVDFIALSGDHHPLHTDPSYAQSKGFETNIVHGMLTASFLSTLIGHYLPIKDCMYISQTLTFHRPVYPNTSITVEGIIKKGSALGVLSIATKIFNEQKQLVLSGEAKVKQL